MSRDCSRADWLLRNSSQRARSIREPVARATHVRPFDSAEQAQRFDRRPVHPRLLAELDDLLHLSGSEQVLDVGTGTGRVALRLLPLLPAGGVIGVDAAMAMLQRAGEKRSGAAGYRLIQGAAEHLPIRGGTADVALFAFALHHLADPLAGLREAGRALKEDGRLVILDPVAAEPVDDLDLALHSSLVSAFRPSQGSGFQFLTLREMRDLVERAGFVVSTAREVGLTFDDEALEQVPMGRHWHEAFAALAGDARLRERFQVRYLSFDGNPPRATGRLLYAGIAATRGGDRERRVES